MMRYVDLPRRYLLRWLPMLVLLLPAPVIAQSAPDWNSARAMELVERARTRRMMPSQDTTLRNYTARAEGFVYFYLDRRESDERTLVKVDQVALELQWAPPDRTRQRIVGLRDESRLPNRMHYHLDHLTVVQNGFGDVIRMGDGDEVRDVPHPAAPGSDSIYEFRLADSLTIQLPTAGSAIRVYELEVRPLDRNRPALVGSMFIDRGTADIVRMTFTFTPSSYVDRRLDYISVSLDNGLWEGRYWLPNEQTLEIRRQIPELDFAAGAVIQGRMRIADYVFNDTTAPRLFGTGRGVTAAPAAEREAYEFDRDLYADLNDAGLAPPPDLESIRQQAADLLGTRMLSGLPRLRLGLGSVSSALRYNRAEGISIGAGIAYVPGDPWRIDLSGGFAFGPERPWGELDLARHAATGTDALRVSANEPADLGLKPVLPGAANSLSAAFLGRDYTAPYYVTGARLDLVRTLRSRLRVGMSLVGERHRSAVLTQDAALFDEQSEFRPVLPIDDGDLSAVLLHVQRPMMDARANDWSAGVDLEIGAFNETYYARPTVRAAMRRSSADLRRDIVLSARAGLVTSDAPSQRLFLLGGMGTLPGYRFHSFAGRRFALVDAQASFSVLDPWLRLRAVAAAGAAGGLPDPGDEDGPAWHSWNAAGMEGVRASAGGGVSLFWDVLRIDAVRGLNAGDWRLVVSFRPDLLDIS